VLLSVFAALMGAKKHVVASQSGAHEKVGLHYIAFCARQCYKQRSLAEGTNKKTKSSLRVMNLG
jgi:hypothetical protein